MDHPIVGTVVSRTRGTVTQRDFQRWAAAVDDLNPLYFDAEYARAHGYEDVVAPPLYLQYATLGVTTMDQLRPDGTPDPDGWGDLPLDGYPRRMAGGQDVTFHHPVYAGTTLTATRTITAITRKTGRTGPFLLVTAMTSYTTDDNTLIAEITDTLIARP